MKKPGVYIDKKCHESLMSYLDLQQTMDLKGSFTDLDLFYKDEWLLDSAVIENVSKRNGNWDVYLVFAHVDNPLKLIKRRITRYVSLEKAELAANYMRRLAAKDARGTLKIERSKFLSIDN